MDSWLEKVQAVVDWFKGKKTYFVAAIAAILGLLTQTGVTIPIWLYTVLGFLGLITLKAGQTRIESGEVK